MLKQFSTTIGRLIELSKRNTKLFFKNKASVFFALLAPILIFLLYTIFLSDFMSAPLLESIGVDANYIEDSVLDAVKSAWMIGGVLSMACFTIGLNSTLVMVEDKEKKAIGDFLASPLKPSMLLTSYFLSAFFVTYLSTLAVLVLGFVYLGFFTALAITIIDFFLMAAILALGCLSAVAMMICIISFFKSNATSAAFTGIFSAIIGFLIGAYMPAGLLPSAMQSITGLIPGSHTTVLFRRVLLNRTMQTANIPYSATDTITQFFSLEVNLFGFVPPTFLLYIFLVASVILFATLFFTINYFLRKRKLQK